MQPEPVYSFACALLTLRKSTPSISYCLSDRAQVTMYRLSTALSLLGPWVVLGEALQLCFGRRAEGTA